MSRKFRHKHFDTWTTDDKQIVFEFTALTYDEEQIPELHLQIFFVALRNGNRAFLGEVKDLPVNEKLQLERIIINKGVCSLSGHLLFRIDRNNEVIHLVVLADIVYMCNGRQQYAFTGPIFVMPVNGLLLPDDCITDREPDAVPEGNDPYPDIRPARYQDLFPYTYISNWPEPGDREVSVNFITFSSPGTSPPGNSYYDRLAELRSEKDLTGLTLEAVKFIEGDAPYEGLFVSDPGSPGFPLHAFAKAVKVARMEKSGEGFLAVLTRLSGSSIEALSAYLQSPEYRKDKERIWYSYFSLVLRPGYRPKLAETLTEILIACHALELLLPLPEDGRGYSPQEMHEMLYATIVLPSEVFPLQEGMEAVAGGMVMPYAIGRLQLVRYRLLRYEAGEIASITNVMPGEKKKLVKRKLSEFTHKASTRKENFDESEDESGEVREDIEKEVSRALAGYDKVRDYTNMNSSYAPPANIVVDGSCSVSRTAGNPGRKSITDFARKILQNTARSITQKVSRARSLRIHDEWEEQEISQVDNTSGEHVVSGVYRWLNKVYEAQVVNFGNRLVISFTIERPAGCYLYQRQVRGEAVCCPSSPEKLGIRSFEDISFTNYAGLCAYYKIQDIELPPAAELSRTATLEWSGSSLITLPEGYVAHHGALNYILAPDASLTVNGMLGRTSFQISDSGIVFTAAAPASPPSVPEISAEYIPMHGEQGSVGFAAASALFTASPPSLQQGSFIISAEVICVPTAHAVSEWKIRIFSRIMEAYEMLRQEYYAGFRQGNSGSVQSNPQRNRKIIRDELKRGCLSLLLSDLPGEARLSPPEHLLDETRFEQFLNHAFEWEEMSFSFRDDNRCHTDYPLPAISTEENDLFFAAFLQAASAKVFVPVRPGFSHRMLFFLAMDMLWAGNDLSVPVTDAQTGLVSELKKVLRREKQEGEEVLDCWEVLVPTSLQILDKGKNDFTLSL